MPHVYRGGSMLGTFRRGDRISIVPAALGEIRPGDVIAFRAVDRGGVPRELVHRVVVVGPGRLLTRGDNSRQLDSEWVVAENLLGRVTHVEREGRQVSIRGGRAGLFQGRLLHAWVHVRDCLIRVGRRPYGWLRASRWVPRLWRPTITRLRVVSEKGLLVKYLYGGRTVARWWPAQGRFECDKPYDLVIPRPDGGA